MASPGVNHGTPRMADLMAGPNAPLTKAFLFCGWECITVDWLIDPSHDLANPLRQASLHEQPWTSLQQPWIEVQKVGRGRYPAHLMMDGRLQLHSDPNAIQRAYQTSQGKMPNV